MKAVIVRWLDAVSQDEWTDLKEAVSLEPPTMKTLGYLVHEDEKKIVIAASYDADNEKVASLYAIPKTWLLEIEEIDV